MESGVVSQGQITRQYLYLADQPIAVIDTPGGKLLLKEKLSAPESIGLDAQNIIKYVITADPIIHDQSNALRFGNPLTAPAFQTPGYVYGTNRYVVEDRVVNGGQGGGRQRTQTFGAAEAGGNRSLTNAETHGFINYTARPADIATDTRRTQDIQAVVDLRNRTGTVNIQAYTSWLRQHGYAFAGVGEF